MSDNASDGDIAAEFTTKYPLPRFAAALLGKELVKIVAMGSSSTAGREDVVPYPSRLEMYLRRKYGNPRIDVVNRGRGGEEAIDELLRFDADIFAEKPSLVIWQVGTNAVFHKYNLDDVAAKILEGLARLREYPIDVVMMDPQYVTAMLLDDKADASERMVSLIAGMADKVRVNVFRPLGADAALACKQHPVRANARSGRPHKLHQNDCARSASPSPRARQQRDAGGGDLKPLLGKPVL
jgi:hypothetical protein